jgi:hypothetical protein
MLTKHTKDLMLDVVVRRWYDGLKDKTSRLLDQSISMDRNLIGSSISSFSIHTTIKTPAAVAMSIESRRPNRYSKRDCT